MAKVTLTLHGFEPLQRAMKTSPDLVRVEAEGAVQRSTFSTASRAKAIVPVRTGKLKQSITTRVRGLNGRVMIEGDAFYWRFVEYGTVKMSARPFIRPAAEAEGPVYVQSIRAIGTKLERAWPTGTGGRFV